MSSTDTLAGPVPDMASHAPRRGPRSAALKFIRREPIACFFALLTLVFVILAICAPLVTGYGPTRIVANPLEQPSRSHILGTDELGRDLFSRVIYGARVSLSVGFLATLIGIL